MNFAVIEGENEIIKEIENIFPSKNIKRSSADLGGGADWWFHLLVITGLFIQGKTINENIDGWIEIGKKIKRIFKKQNKGLVYIDIQAAIALAIGEINSKTEIKSLNLIDATELNQGKRINKGFKSNFSHLNYYVLIFEINEIENFIFCIKSNGEIKLSDYFERSEWNYKFDWKTYHKKT